MINRQNAKPKRLLCLLLTLAMVLGMIPAMSFTASALSGSGDRISDPFMVNTYDELKEAMKTRAWISDSSNDSATYIALNSDILIEDSTSDNYLDMFNSKTHNLSLDLNGHSLIRRTDSSDKYMFDVKCHLAIGDRKGGGTIRFKTTASDGDTAVFFHNTNTSLLEIFDGAYVVNDTAEHSGYTNCGVMSKRYGAWIYVGDCRIAAQLPLKTSAYGKYYVNGASLCSTSKSSYVALNCNSSLSIDNCTAYGDIMLETGYPNKVSTAFQGTTIYRNGIKKDFSSILDSYSATIPANGGVLTVTNHEDPFIENVDITDVTAPYGGTKVGDFSYKVATENVIDMGVTVVSSGGIALTSDKLFVGGENYKYYIHVMPKGGYMLKANAITGVSTGTINGESVETVTHPSWYSSMGTDIRLISTFTAIQGVTEFSATVSEPVVGSTPSFVVIPGDSEAYTATVYRWESKGKNANYTTSMTEDSAFQYGYTYTAFVRFELNEGYTTPTPIAKTPGTLNGQEAKSVAPQNQDEYQLLYIKFTTPDPPTTEYYMTVYYGDARNENGYIITRAAVGTKITLTADEPEEGQVFDRWSYDENLITLDDPFSPTASFVMPEANINAIVARFKDANAGNSTVSGTVTSYGSDTDDVTVQLIESGTSKTTYETIVHGNTAGYSISDVEAGTYTMKVMKNGHVTREYTVVVEAEDVTQDAKIHLLGDVNMDGKVSIHDATEVQKGIAGLVSLSDYQRKLADANKDGNASVVDATHIQKYIAGIINSL